ncbi:GGDEF domain-containing protein [Echinimonas agarilytica]|uniref:diguanylate cyclase n=1 Tax=Echinimonas agarilytica TaxID=1215918 RepID=A0AA41W5Q1_9GAMM|nr:GGDEF domain-containing protein [Echinimonas agarilytica]MCM2679203.1 GGDEF domain-containing protein [Echinimonas agarilytica]
MKLRNLLSLFSFAIAILPIVTISLLLLYQQNKSIERSMSEDFKQTMVNLERDADFNIELFANAFKVFTRDRRLILALENFLFTGIARKEMAEFSSQRRLLTSLYLMNRDLDVVEEYKGRISALEQSTLLSEIKDTQQQGKLSTDYFYIIPFENQDLIVKNKFFQHEIDSPYGLAVVTPLFLNILQDGSKQEPEGFLIAVVSVDALYQVIEKHLAPTEGVEIIGDKGRALMSSYNGNWHEEGSGYANVEQQITIGNDFIANPMSFKLVLHADKEARTESLKQSYETVVIGVLLTLLVTLIAVILLFRQVSAPFARLASSLKGFSIGNYEPVKEQNRFIEFEEVRLLLNQMGDTIRKQFSHLEENNDELERANQLKDKYLDDVKTLNASLEQRVAEQTSELRSALSREESNRNVLEGIVDVSIKLQRIGKRQDMFSLAVDSLHEIMAKVPVAFYLGASKYGQSDYYSVAMDASDNSYIRCSLSRFDYRKSSAVPRQLDGMSTSYQVFTMGARDDLFLGALVMKKQDVTSDAVAIIGLYAKQVSTTLDALQLKSELENVARTDELTNLPNRKAFNEDLNLVSHRHVRYPQSHIGMFVIDVNGLKNTNDKFGHDAGDNLICSVANMLSRICRQSDRVYRLGGDEFAILIAEGSDESCRGMMARLVRENERQVLSVNDKSGNSSRSVVSFSTGYASTESVVVADLFQVADAQMYRQKEAYYQTKLND